MASSREELEDIPNQLLQNPMCPEYIKEVILRAIRKAQRSSQERQAEDREKAQQEIRVIESRTS